MPLQKQFKTRLNADGKLLPFSFTFMSAPPGGKYFVTVTKDNQPFWFDMIKNEEGKWSIIDPAPPWIKRLEHELSESIIQNDV
jgi:hypothetical protein